MTKSRRNEFNKILKEYYGYDALKELQYKVIKSVTEGKDTIALFPTSYGKSLCFQIPYLITRKNVIVVSPLISLMEDQTRELKLKNIGAVCLNSVNKKKDKDLSEIYDGETKIIYTTPEYLINNQDFIENMVFVDSLALIAIDECHCVSSWGHSFRSDYQKLDYLKSVAPKVPILALTATATDKVINDVAKSLQLNEPKIYKHSVDRPNLFLHIEQKQKNCNIIEDKIVPLIDEELKKEISGKILIYCKTVKDTDKVALKLQELGYKCESYHAQKSTKERCEIQKEYTSGKLNIISSTIAFGMGINIPNIRLMIHYNCSNDIESYMQEIGRAGRDNNDSQCYMFFSDKDFILNMTFLEEIKDLQIRKYKEHDIKYLREFVTTLECRRKCLLRYFDEELPEDCKKCDNCVSKKHSYNFTKEIHMLFSLMSKFFGNFGTNTYVKLLLGSKDKQVAKYIETAGTLHGKGNIHNEHWWKKLVNILFSNGYLVENKIKTQKMSFSVIKMTQKSEKWLDEYNLANYDNKPQINFNISIDDKEFNNKNSNENKNKNIDIELEHAKIITNDLAKKNKKIIKK